VSSLIVAIAVQVEMRARVKGRVQNAADRAEVREDAGGIGLAKELPERSRTKGERSLPGSTES
jgi:hypothetical protein